MGRTKGSKNKPKIGGDIVMAAAKPAPISEVINLPKEYTALEMRVAETLHKYCQFPGCQPRLHLGEARNVINIVRMGD
jgi:hypothetical protein